MFSRLGEVERRFEELEMKLADPAIAGKSDEFRRVSRERAGMVDLVEAYRRYKAVCAEIDSNKALLEDNDFRQMAKEELARLEPEKMILEERMKILLLPKDPNDDKNILLEIRAGAGGDEAGIFAGELFRMYQKYAAEQGWKVELLSLSENGVGGFKEIVGLVTGANVYSKLKYEGGVHRVQRVPQTETQGRVHTSTVTVAVLAEAEEVDLVINPVDLKIDVFRSGGKGGQSVNTTDSAVRITHLPTNTVVVCQDERSQLKNKDKAMKVLRSRLLAVEQERAAKEHADSRRSMVGTGDRSERIRTYNFPQSRLTDHRIGLTLHNLPEVMEGKIGSVVDALVAHNQAELLKSTQGGQP